jgi:hypothetical protein
MIISPTFVIKSREEKIPWKESFGSKGKNFWGFLFLNFFQKVFSIFPPLL